MLQGLGTTRCSVGSDPKRVMTDTTLAKRGFFLFFICDRPERPMDPRPGAPVVGRVPAKSGP
jgi:hypothetical protein